MAKRRKLTEEHLARFSRHLALQERSAATMEKYLRDAGAFAAFMAGADVTRERVLAYKQHLQQRYAVRSVNSILASLNGLFACLGWEELRVKSLRMQRQVFCPEEKELTRAEYVRLCKTAKRRHNHRTRLLLQTLCGTGIRVSELRYITVEAARQGVAVVQCKGKVREIFIVEDLAKRLLRYAAERGIRSGMVFVTRTGRPMSRVAVWRALKALCKDAGVRAEKVFPHNLRHLFARVFYSMEKDIARLADILGHSSISTTRLYVISTGAEHRRQMEHMRLIL